MAKTYYAGDLEKDLLSIKDDKFTQTLDEIGKSIGYGRAQQMLQILWAKSLKDSGVNTMGALLPEPLTQCTHPNLKLHPIAGDGWYCGKCKATILGDD